MLQKKQAKFSSSDESSSESLETVTSKPPKTSKGKNVLRVEVDSDSSDPLTMISKNHLKKKSRRVTKKTVNQEEKDSLSWSSSDPMAQIFHQEGRTGRQKIRKSQQRATEEDPYSEDEWREFTSGSDYESPKKRKPFSENPILTSTHRMISESTIKQRWKHLDTKQKKNLGRALKNVASPILRNIRSDQKKIEIERELDLLISNINKRLEDLPAPKHLKNAIFDNKILADQNRALRKSLVSETEHLKYMERQLSMEKRLLAQEQENLLQIKIPANSSKFHPIMEVEPEDSVSIKNGPTESNLNPLFDHNEMYLQDDQLNEIKKSLSMHLRSIDNQTQMMEGLLSRIPNAEHNIWGLIKITGLQGHAHLCDYSELTRQKVITFAIMRLKTNSKFKIETFRSDMKCCF
ncbi:hypothetical protein G9A89_003614 [Geosiphon pyriformis]|nr:hypothetical protein G9A89_003614 [Geosiphon pyriformis]